MTNAVLNANAPLNILGMSLEEFSVAAYRRSYSFVGILCLVRAALIKAPDNALTRDAIKTTVKALSPFAVAQVDDVIDTAFRIDVEGRVYSPSLDRLVQALKRLDETRKAQVSP